MQICDNCEKKLDKDFISLRMNGVYYKMAIIAGVSTLPDLCSTECVIKYCSKVGK